MKTPVPSLADKVRARAATDVAEALGPQRLLDPSSDDEARAWALISRRLAQVQREEANAGRPPLGSEDAEQLAQGVFDELLRLGPLQRYVSDPEVEDVIVNGHERGFVMRTGGRKEAIETGFSSEEELNAFVARTVASTGRRLDHASPAVDARLLDGSRLHAIVPPLAPFTCVTIRHHRLLAHSLADLERLGTLGPVLRKLLEAAVRARCNVLISGGTATGKTTALNALSAAIPPDERVVTIEETAELAPDRHLPDCVALEARFANIQGAGAVAIRALVRHALRMRPTRIVVGEVRGPEALDMLLAMNSGHPGSMGTLHADSARQAVAKLRTYAMAAEEHLSSEVVSDMIGDTIDLVVHLRAEGNGRRRVAVVAETAGVEAGRVLLNELFVARDAGEPRWTGVVPRRMSQLHEAGFEPRSLGGDTQGWP